MSPQPVVIIGFGYVGFRIAREELFSGCSVSALTRSTESTARAKSLGVWPIACDLDDPVSLKNISARDAVVYYLAPPSPTGVRDLRMTNFLRAIDAAAPAKLVYISTTGVYGNTQGAWVNENSPLDPQQDRSRRRCDAEMQINTWSAQHPRCCVTVLRVGGIYGPDKLPLARLAKQEPMVDDPGHPSWVNVIHVDDLVTICRTAARTSTPLATYNVSDGHPTTMMQYFRVIADVAGLAPPPTISLAEAKTVMSPEMFSYVAESRRVDTSKLRRELNPDLRYTVLAEGIRAAFLASGK